MAARRCSFRLCLPGPLVCWSLTYSSRESIQSKPFLLQAGEPFSRGGGLRWLGAVALPQWRAVKARLQLPGPGSSRSWPASGSALTSGVSVERNSVTC